MFHDIRSFININPEPNNPSQRTPFGVAELVVGQKRTMTTLKKQIVYALLLCYVATVATGLYVIMGGSEIASPAIVGIFSAIVVQTAAIIVAFIKAPEYFTEPEAITHLQKQHAQAVDDLQAKLTQSLQDRENMIGWIGTKIMPDDPKHPFYAWIKSQQKKD